MLRKEGNSVKNYLLEMVRKRKLGIHCGIPSFCCANKLVIEAILDQAQRFDDTVLIEATSNQVNQYRGYMGMLPQDFSDYVYSIADKIGFSRKKIILGGDHLGPLPWVDEPAAQAMEKAAELVRLSVLAGYQKIHLDTSMRLGDDPIDRPLETATIARRGAYLYNACEEAYQQLLKKDPTAEHPVFVIGSEVPIPGGIQSDDEGMQVTRPEDFEDTLLTYRDEFAKLGLSDAWQYIIAVVVQPGVEFGNEQLHHYNRSAAKKLCEALKRYPDIVFEGHSTDFQSPTKLKEMVEDGIAIIKVGPALTFALREALFALSGMERELIDDPAQRANFPEVLEEAMLKNPKQWEKHYSGTEKQLHLEREYSFSDRCRYYLSQPEVDSAIAKLFYNLDQTDIPLGMLHQYMPLQYIKVRDGRLPMQARELVKDSIITLVDDYNYAVKYNYMTGGIFIR